MKSRTTAPERCEGGGRRQGRASERLEPRPRAAQQPPSNEPRGGLSTAAHSRCGFCRFGRATAITVCLNACGALQPLLGRRERDAVRPACADGTRDTGDERGRRAGPRAPRAGLGFGNMYCFSPQDSISHAPMQRQRTRTTTADAPPQDTFARRSLPVIRGIASRCSTHDVGPKTRTNAHNHGGMMWSEILG